MPKNREKLNNFRIKDFLEGEVMDKWEYKVIAAISDSLKRPDHKSAEEKLTISINEHAKNGWEPIGITSEFNPNKDAMVIHCLLRRLV